MKLFPTSGSSTAGRIFVLAGVISVAHLSLSLTATGPAPPAAPRPASSQVPGTALSQVPGAGSSLPNIVLIMADDLGYGDLSCYGATRIQTPATDSLAAGGMRFSNVFCSSSLCSPSRYSLMTGRYSWRSWLKKGVLKWFAPPLVENDRLTLGSMLRQQGYRTAYIGKWHLGFDWALSAENPPSDPVKQVFDTWERTSQDYIDFSAPVEEGPLERGFDYFYGIAASNNMIPFVFIENDRVLQPPSVEKDYVYDTDQPCLRAPDWDLERLDRDLTKKAVEVIDHHFSGTASGDDPSGRPLFLFFSTAAVHRPCLPTRTKGKSRAGLRGDMVVEFDNTVSRIVEVLRRQGELENTLLIVTSDNGAVPGDPVLALERYRRDLGDQFYLDYSGEQKPAHVDPDGNEIARKGWFTYGHASAGPWRGFKGGAWDGGFRVPLIMHWPARIAPGRVNANMICNADLMATLAQLTGFEGATGEDSYSYLPNILGESSRQVRRSMVLAAGRSGERVVRTDSWKLIGEQLYHIKNDLAEEHNVYSRYPDTAATLRALAGGVAEQHKKEDQP